MFLDLFEKKYKGPIINIILNQIREGYYFPDDVINRLKFVLNRREKYILPNHLKILKANLDNEEIYPLIEEYIRYLDLPREQQLRVKQIKINSKQMQKKLIKDIINNKRPMSWSSISSWKYSKEDWANKYIDDAPKTSSPEMEFGKKIGKLLETKADYLPQVPRHSKMEHKFMVKVGGIPLVGYADTFCDNTFKKLGEYKTGKKEWDQKRVDEHGQIDMYLLMNYVTNKIRPEDVEVTMVWLPTKDDSDFSISFVEPIEDNIKIFKTKRTTTDIVKFAAEIKRIYKEMELYCENRAKNNNKIA
jgi:hypothetical protein